VELCSQWYTPLALLRYKLVSINILIASIVLALGLIFVKPSMSKAPASINAEAISANAQSHVDSALSLSDRFASRSILNLVVGTLLCVGLMFLFRVLFPVGEFAIGVGARRRTARVFWRRALGTGFLLSVAASLIAALIFAGASH
jgi:hypothetical protein